MPPGLALPLSASSSRASTATIHSQRRLPGSRRACFLHPSSRTSSERVQELLTLPIFVTEKVHVGIERNRAIPTKWRTGSSRRCVGGSRHMVDSKKTSLNGCSFLSPGRKVCLLILKEEGLKMMNPLVGRKKSCRMLSKGNFFPSAFGRPLSSADTRPGARTGIQAGANIDWAAASSCVAEFVTSSSCSFFRV